MGLALSPDEMRRIQEHFKGLGRDPTEVELQSLGQAWSEHCCYKSSKVFLKEFIFPVQAPYVIDRGDAGVVEFDEDHAYALRIESHNHPSAIEPYGGANTGIGGILRDVLAMGAQPIALADPLTSDRSTIRWRSCRAGPGTRSTCSAASSRASATTGTGSASRPWPVASSSTKATSATSSSTWPASASG